MEEQEKKDFTFVDKRKTKDDDIKEKTTEIPEEKVSHSISEEELNVLNLARGFISFLSGLAWCNLGLVPHPQTGKIKKNLSDAKLSIDIVNSIFEIISNNLQEEEKKQFKTTLSDLKLNYVNISSKE